MSQSTFYGKENNAKTTITNNPLAAGGLSITLDTGDGALFPSGVSFLVTIWDDTTYPDDPTSDPNMEVCLIDSRSTDTLTVNASGRGYSGTADVEHASGSAIALHVMKEHMEQLETAINTNEASVQGGWNALSETLTFNAVDDPTGVVDTSADLTSFLSVGMRLKMTNAGNTIYAIITAIDASTITFLHEIDSTDSQALHLLEDSAITAVSYSCFKAPYGFPTDPIKWQVLVTDNSDQQQTTPTQNTWYNLGSIVLNVPIGAWELSYKGSLGATKATTTSISVNSTLSTANNSESDDEFTEFTLLTGASATFGHYVPVEVSKHVAVTSKTPYYLNGKTTTAAMSSIRFAGNNALTVVRAVCAYL